MTRMPFKGTVEDWFYWEGLFLSRAQYYGFQTILLGHEKAPRHDESLDLSTEEGQAKKHLRKMNERAYFELTVNMDLKSTSGKLAYRIVKNAKTADLPQGDAREAWIRLCEEFDSDTGAVQMELKRKFYGAQMRSNQNPVQYMTQLQNCQEKLASLGMSISDEELMLQVIDTLPKNYENTQDMLKVEYDRKSLTLSELKKRLREKFVGLNKRSGAKLISLGDEDKEQEESIALTSTASNNKPKCGNCGKFGHTAANCWAPGGGKEGQGPKRNKGFKGLCRCCGKYGHKMEDCFFNPKSPKYKGPKDENGTATNQFAQGTFGYESDQSFMAKTGSGGPGARRDVWVGDTGATCHMTGFDEGFVDWQPSEETVVFGNGDALKVKKVGTWKGICTNPDGTTVSVTLRNVKLVPGIVNNLFAINRSVDKGWEYVSRSDYSTLTGKGKTLVFKTVTLKNGGSLREVDLKASRGTESDNIANAAKSGPKVQFKTLHHKLGHASRESVKATASHFGWELTGELEKCTACAVGKTKRKKLNRELQPKSSVPGERLFLDISSVKATSIGGAKFWLLVLDDATDMCWSFFLKEKSELAEVVLQLLLDLRFKHNRTVKFIRCDNAGENMSLQKRCDKGGLGIQFEFTAVRTPEQNGRVERLYQTLYGRVRATLRGAKIGYKYRQKLWAECGATLTKTYVVTVKKSGEKTPYEKFYGKLPGYTNFLRRFGEVGVVARFGGGAIKGKLADRGVIAVFVGYASDHAGDVYRMLNPSTGRVTQTRDVEWLNTYHWGGDDDDSEPPAEWYGIFDEDEKQKNEEDAKIENQQFFEENVETNTGNGGVETADKIADAKIRSALKKLDTWYNPSRNEGGEFDTTEGITLRSGKTIGSLAMCSIAMPSQVVETEIGKPKNVRAEIGKNSEKDGKNDESGSEIEPTSFEKAWDHPDPTERKLWREAVKKEFGDMDTRKVWTKIPKNEMPKDRRCVKCKWVFKIKRNGVHRARLVACGYSQVPGVDYTDNFAPVINDITFRILLIVVLLFGFETKIVDVETAFLHGELEEDIYMECPPGLEGCGKEDCLRLNKSIYGLVQGARQFWKKLVEILTDGGFDKSDADPCLMTKKDALGWVFMALYVDDCLIVGNSKPINETINHMRKKGLSLKITEELEDYLSCDIKLDRKNKKGWIGQPHLIQDLESKFWEMVKHLTSYRTPGTPGAGITKPTEEQLRLEPDAQEMYRSGVGMLLFLVKHTRPEISNAVRELSKVVSGASKYAMKEFMRTTKYVLDTKEFGLKLDVNSTDEKWEMVVYTDSDYAGDKETRRSVTGFIIYLRGVPVSWKSRGQKCVTLSSTEAEFVALSEAAKEIKFVVQVLRSMKMQVKMPIVVRVDNVGAIGLSKNLSTSQRTKHIDVRYHFVREFVEEKMIEIVFVRSEENHADIFTKNVSGDVFEKHAKHFVGKYEKMP